MATKKPATKRTRSTKAGRGRPTKCTEATIAAIVEGLRAGMGREAAARRAGIGVATFHEWMAKGAEGRAPYADFRRRVEGASDDLHHEVATVMLDALRSENPHVASGQARWFAERLWPDVYGRRSEVRQTGPDGGPVQVEAKVEVEAGLTPETMDALSPEAVADALVKLARGGAK